MLSRLGIFDGKIKQLHRGFVVRKAGMMANLFGSHKVGAHAPTACLAKSVTAHNEIGRSAIGVELLNLR